MLQSRALVHLCPSRSWHIRYASSVATGLQCSRETPETNLKAKTKTNNHDRTNSDSVNVTKENSLDPHTSQSDADSASGTQHRGRATRGEAGLIQRERAVSSKPGTAATHKSPARKAPCSAQPTPRIYMNAAAKHNDLESFLDYASRVGLNPSTNVYRGTHYEYTVAKTLKAYNFSLHRTGRSNDLGIDLLGHWALPADDHGYRVLVQCKATQATPSMIRELEGSFAGAPAGWNSPEAMALLATAKAITPGVLQAAQRSRLAMGVLQIRTDGLLQQFIWNQAAEQARLSGLTVANVYNTKDGMARPDALIRGNVEPSIALLWMGSPWKRASR